MVDHSKVAKGDLFIEAILFTLEVFGLVAPDQCPNQMANIPVNPRQWTISGIARVSALFRPVQIGHCALVIIHS